MFVRVLPQSDEVSFDGTAGRVDSRGLPRHLQGLQRRTGAIEIHLTSSSEGRHSVDTDFYVPKYGELQNIHNLTRFKIRINFLFSTFITRHVLVQY